MSVAVAAPGSAGGDHNLALRANGTVAAWGCDCYGATNVPPGLSNVVAIAAGGVDGYGHSLVIVADGLLFTSARLEIGLSNGLARIAIEDEPHRRYVLESTPALGNAATWRFERNVRLTNSLQTVHQFTVPQTDTQFYRVRQIQ